MNGALYLIGWDAMRRHGKIYSDPASSYGILMDRLHSIEIETAADFAYASYVIEHGMLDAVVERKDLKDFIVNSLNFMSQNEKF